MGGDSGTIIVRRIRQVLTTKFTETAPIKVWHMLAAMYAAGYITRWLTG